MKKKCCKLSTLFFVLLAAFQLTFEKFAMAAQEAEVTYDSLSVYEKPWLESPVIATVKKRERVRVSTGTVKDDIGTVWYKVKLPDGVMGYVEADGLVTSSLALELQHSGVAIASQGDSPSHVSVPWTTVIRVMVLGGSQVNIPAPRSGGEFELTYCIPFASVGYLHRMISLGPMVQMTTKNTVVGGSLVYRIYTPVMVEPEIRLRGGIDSSTTQFYLGANLGISHPVIYRSGIHMSVYMEAGSWFKTNLDEIQLWAAFGLGFHL